MVKLKAKGPKSMEEALSYLSGSVKGKDKAPHAIQIHGVTYLNQRALLKNLEILRDWAINDFKEEVQRIMEEEDVDIRATKDYQRQSVHNLKMVSGVLINYVKDCVEFSEDDWELKRE